MNLKIDMQNPAHIQAAAAFFNSLAGLTPSESLSIVAAEPAADKLAAKKPAAEKPAAEKPAAEKPAAEKPAAQKLSESDTSDETVKSGVEFKTEDKKITREDLILLVSELSSNAPYKAAMRDKLDEFGAKNTRSLTTDQYKPFYDFLVGLKNPVDDLPY